MVPVMVCSGPDGAAAAADGAAGAAGGGPPALGGSPAALDDWSAARSFFEQLAAPTAAETTSIVDRSHA